MVQDNKEKTENEAEVGNNSEIKDQAEKEVDQWARDF